MNEWNESFYWDDFAEEYYAIQKESRVPITKDIVASMKANGILPAKSVIDVCGGAGRYLQELAPLTDRYTLMDFSTEMLHYAEKEREAAQLENVTFVNQSLDDFLENDSIEAEVLFAALVPPLQTIEQVEQMTQKTSKWCVVLRMLDQKDSLFTPIDTHFGLIDFPEITDAQIMNRFEDHLKRKGYFVKAEDFIYQFEEEVSKDFFEEYYEEYQETEYFLDRVNEEFLRSDSQINTTTIHYRALYWKK